jgi:hypothetical protein
MFKITFEGNSKFPVPNFYVYISHLRHSLVDAFYERTVVRGWKQHSNLFVSGFFFIIINCVQCLVTFDSSSPMLQSETRVSKNCPPCQHHQPATLGTGEKKNKIKWKGRKKLKMHRVGHAVILSERHRQPIDHDWKTERRVKKKKKRRIMGWRSS